MIEAMRESAQFVIGTALVANWLCPLLHTILLGCQVQLNYATSHSVFGWFWICIVV